jgi:hypothetical protein
MEAIRINAENYDKILAHSKTSVAEFYKDSLLGDLEGRDWYYIPVMDDARSDYVGWSLYHRYDLERLFEFDSVKIQTDFVKIQRKEAVGV